ncbi:MAG: hypothetical protein V3U96_00350 [Paracoccaceae bacterium]
MADLIGVKNSSIGGLVQKGVVKKAGRNLYARRVSVRNYCERLRTSQVGRPSANPEMNAEKLRLVRAQAEKQEKANAKTSGDLLDAKEVAADWTATMVDLRAAILAIPQRVASNCGLDRNAMVELDTEIRAALEVIADDH